VATSRRGFLQAVAGTLAAQERWDAGAVRHLLPTASHDALLLKASFSRPLPGRPRLRIGSRAVEGVRADTAGEFFWFHAGGLEPGRTYQLNLLDAGGQPLCAPWPIRTFPHPGSRPQRFRLMVYTCAGGHDAIRNLQTGGPYWVPLMQRRRLLENGLRQRPDAVVAIGDHVYWDLRSPKASLHLGASPAARKVVGDFERSAPVLGTDNERKLKLAVTPQIADLYGALFRSTPVFFMQDDHDYFENDEATEQMVTFPPDDFMLRLARATQRLYYPEFLPEAGRPAGLPGASPPDRAPAVSESYGTLRYGKLVEMLLYDCRRNLTLKGSAAGFLPDTVEDWLRGRMSAQETHHVVNVPSTPVGWSAGKWGEWYPDLLEASGKLGVSKPKYFWQAGWRAQHDRLLTAASGMQRIPLFLSGDLHALAEGRIQRSGAVDLRHNPVVTVLTGPVSTGPVGWPSVGRGTPPQTPTGIEVEEGLPPLEKNGFTIIDFSEDRIEFQFFNWKMGEPEERLADLTPFHRFEARRQG